MFSISNLISRNIIDIVYPVAGLDFLVDSDGKLVFLEANSVPAGLGIISYISQYFDRKYSSKISELYDFNSFILGRFYRLVKKLSLGNGKVIMLVPNDFKGILNFDRELIFNYLKKRGVNIRRCTNKQIILKGNKILFNVNGEVFSPSVIIRRVFSFKKCLKVNVINPSETGSITQNKWKTFSILMRKLGKSTYFYLPETILVEKVEQLYDALDYFMSKGKKVILKPLKGHGGKGITIIDKMDKKISKKIKILKTPILVQEKIETMGFQSYDRKKYFFDIRSFIIGGKFAGMQLRRSPKPISSNDKKGIITNISSGGHYVHVFLGEVDKFDSYTIENKTIILNKKTPPIDGNIAVIDSSFLKKIIKASEIITKALGKNIFDKYRECFLND